MMETAKDTVQQPRWWAEAEMFWLLLIVLVAQFVRLDALPVRGEESRRAHLAAEMIRTGDWLVPRQQDEPVFFRPPLQNWAIAGVALIRGECDVWAARLPSVLALLAMTFILYGYGRSFLSRAGAFACAIAYATMAEVLQLGGLAETEGLFTLFVGGSLVIWHWGYSRGWPALWMWVLSYALVALGTLTKGSQAPIYFGGAVVVFLLWKRDWRRLFSKEHAAGMAVFAVIFGAWFVPYALRMGIPAAVSIMGGEASDRFYYDNWALVLGHLATYPIETIACTLPWSFFLLAYLRPEFRSKIGSARSHVSFFWIAVAVSYPTVWFATGAVTRYWMPIYPCLCPLIALVVERTFAASASATTRWAWTAFMTCMGVILCGVLVVAAAGRVLPFPETWGLRLSFWQITALWLGIGVLVVVLFRNRSVFRPEGIEKSLFAVGGGMALAFAFLFVSILVNRSLPNEEWIDKVKQRIPDGQLVSLGKVHHLFVFHYQRPVPQVDWPKRERDFPADAEYFCFNAADSDQSIPFAWEQIAEINCDRNIRNVPVDVVIVGRRTRDNARKSGRER